MRWLLAAVVAALLAAACGGTALRSDGQTCSASSECAEGLVCNFGVDPHVCASMGMPPPPDAPEVIDANANLPDVPPGTPDARVPDAPGPVDAESDAL